MRPIMISFLCILMTQAPQILLAAQSPQIDPGSTYRLTNDYASGKSLTCSKRGDQYVMTMDDTRDSPEQCWNLTPAGNGTYRLTSIAAGRGKSLDTPKSGDQYVMAMADTGNYSGQMWVLIPVGNGKYRLTNVYAGPMKSLDTPMSGSQYVMTMADTGNYSGQMWTLTKVTPPVAAAPGTIQVPTQVATPTIALAPQIDPNATYRLTSDYLATVITSGPGRSLSVSKSGDNYVVVMADAKDFPDQVWKFIPLGGGKYRLINLAAGEGKSLATQMSGNRYVLSIQNTDNSTGQIWTLTDVGGGKYRLTNDALGPGRSLYISALDPSFSGFLLQMTATSNAIKQFWTLTKVTPQLAQQPPISINLQPPGPPAAKPLTVTGLTWNPSMIPRGGGTMLCSRTSLFDLTQCGLTKADWVGSHVLSTTCDKGFYDPIWGGTCWDFPPDNGEGKWIRSTEPVTNDNAVWRIPKPKEYVAKAERVTRGTAFAWDCPSGTFWDIYDTGGCWKCTDKHPRRTAAPVWADNACAASLNETASAVFLKYNGCPKPNAATMGLKGKRQPGKPFLQLGSGCYACPNADEDGNILVTERNGNIITGDAYANNQGCAIVFKWKPPEFPEPGLSGLEGVREILLENLLFEDPDLVTAYLTKAGEVLGHKPGTPESIRYVSQQWQEIAASPYKSAAVADLVFGFVELAAATDANSRTPAERALVGGVEQYVNLRRTFVAEQALAMYDAWKANDDKTKNQRARSRLEVIGFDYGTVPLDFQAAVMAGFGLGVAGIGAIGAIAGANIHAVSTAKTARDAVVNLKQLKVALDQARAARNVIEAQRVQANITRILSTAARAQRVANVFTAFRALTIATRIGILGPAILIEVVGIILTSIAIDQFMQIIEARPKLQAAVERAKQPVDLQKLLTEPNGKEQLVYFWSKAMDAKKITEDEEVVAKAGAAMEMARQRGYQLSSGQ